jgi:hypothetical protein
MEVFLTLLPSSHLDPFIWSSLCRRLILPVSPPQDSIPAGLRFVQPVVVSPTKFVIPLARDKSVNGIFWRLTKKTKKKGRTTLPGIRSVTVTSKSVGVDPPGHRGFCGSPRNVVGVDLSQFFSKNEPGQWICWDFHELHVTPTHYTLVAAGLKSWVIEGSLDGEHWLEIDRKTNTQDFKDSVPGQGRDWLAASFTASTPVESRFIRLTQTGQRHANDDVLGLRTVEFFGTLEMEEAKT